jgi:hypothetical protein
VRISDLTEIVINDKVIEQVSSFSYLGDISCQQMEDTSKELNKFYFMRGKIHRNFRQQIISGTQLKFYEVIADSVLIYGCENWALSRPDGRVITPAEMKFLRSVSGSRREQPIR